MKLTREEVAARRGFGPAPFDSRGETEFTSNSIKSSATGSAAHGSTPHNIELFATQRATANALRDDRVTNRPGPDSLLANAPDRDGTFFKVPKILE